MNGGMVQEIAALGLERQELAATFGTALIGDKRIPYEPKALAGLVTTIRGFNPKRYLAIEGVSLGGADYITRACEIPVMVSISPEDTAEATKKAFRDKSVTPFDLVSIDGRGLPLTPEEIWKYLEGGKQAVTAFGKGAPTDYGPRKLKAGTLIVFNLADPATKALYFQKRTMDNKMHQSTYAGMIRWT